MMCCIGYSGYWRWDLNFQQVIEELLMQLKVLVSMLPLMTYLTNLEILFRPPPMWTHQKIMKSMNNSSGERDVVLHYMYPNWIDNCLSPIRGWVSVFGTLELSLEMVASLFSSTSSGKCTLSPGRPRTAQDVLETQRHQRYKVSQVAPRAKSKMLTSLRHPGSFLGHPGPSWDTLRYVVVFLILVTFQNSQKIQVYKITI